MSSINLANMDPTLCGLKEWSSRFGNTGLDGALAPVVIPVICTEETGADGAALAAVTTTFLSSETVFTAMSFTVA